MATYLYCVWTDAVTVPVALTGMEGGPVRLLEAAGVHAWVSDVRDGVGTPTVERLRAHDAVCAAGIATGNTPLPVRYGQVFPDDTAAGRALERRAEALDRRLRRVSGCVELRVVVAQATAAREGEQGLTARHEALEEVPAATDRPGTAFLRRLAAAGRADIAREVICEQVRHAVRDEAGSLLVDQVPCETARGMSYFAALIRRVDVTAFTAVVHRVVASHGGDLTVLGPFAPYSFSTDV